eukprot:2783457-Alexandrium_andersonii.AAC.1
MLRLFRGCTVQAPNVRSDCALSAGLIADRGRLQHRRALSGSRMCTVGILPCKYPCWHGARLL